jgi:Gametolysin peptidase M11
VRSSTFLHHFQALRGSESSLSTHTELTQPCTLYKRITMDENGRHHEDWDCQLHPSDGDALVGIQGLDLSNATSGETTLFAPGMSIHDNSMLRLNLSQAVLGQSSNLYRDRRLATSGDLQVVVVRITCGDKVVNNSLATIEAEVFLNPLSLKTQMEACSNGAVTVSRGPLNGLMEVSINSCNDEIVAREATTAAVTQQLGKSPARYRNTVFMYCLPAGVWSRLAYAWPGSWLSVYNNDWCSNAPTQMHEVGHNLNLAHAGEAGNEYGDITGYMGSSSRLESNMCYNAANMYQLGWLRNVGEYDSYPYGSHTLVGHTNNTGGIQAIRLRGIPAGYDTYIWFNHASGINSGTREGQNQIIVTIRFAGLSYSPTTMVAKLGSGQQYVPSDTSYPVLRATNIDLALGQATISFDPPPTLAPVAPPPTEHPSTASLETPTLGPADTPLPVELQIPASPQTLPPVEPPTLMPVLPPTPVPSRRPVAAPVRPCYTYKSANKCPSSRCKWRGARSVCARK